jgi:hypothetical protein
MFDFTKTTDEALFQMHKDFTLGAKGEGEHAEICRAGEEAAYTEMHRRALGIKVRYVSTASTGENANGVRVVNGWTNCERYIGTAREFAETFNLRLVNRPYAMSGECQTVGFNGEIVKMAWQVA